MTKKDKQTIIIFLIINGLFMSLLFKDSILKKTSLIRKINNDSDGILSTTFIDSGKDLCGTELIYGLNTTNPILLTNDNIKNYWITGDPIILVLNNQEYEIKTKFIIIGNTDISFKPLDKNIQIWGCGTKGKLDIKRMTGMVNKMDSSGSIFVINNEKLFKIQ